MTTRHAACSCGALKLTTTGEPIRVSVCHCLACQRRTGSAFGYQARFPRDRVEVRRVAARTGDLLVPVRPDERPPLLDRRHAASSLRSRPV